MVSSIQTTWNEVLSGKGIPISCVYSKEINKRQSRMFLQKKKRECSEFFTEAKNIYLWAKYANSASLGPHPGAGGRSEAESWFEGARDMGRGGRQCGVPAH